MERGSLLAAGAHMSTLTELDGFQFIKTLGHGSYGKVELAFDSCTREKVAIKIIHKKQIKNERQQERLRREIRVLSLVKHPHIIELKKVIETRENIYLVMEYATDGELFDYIVSTHHLRESDCIHYFRQILSAVQYLHTHHILHRDLKPENLLLTNGKHCLKLIDFGFTNIFGTGKLLDTFCGSPYYASPEMISGKNYTGPEVDIWSLGIILYIMVTSKLPFDDTNTNDLFKKICTGKFSLPESLSSSCKDLLKGMIASDTQSRYNIDQIIKHPWVNQGYHTSPNPFIPLRFSLNETSVNESILDHLLKSGYSLLEIKSILYSDEIHPLKSEYFLLVDSLGQGLMNIVNDSDPSSVRIWPSKLVASQNRLMASADAINIQNNKPLDGSDKKRKPSEPLFSPVSTRERLKTNSAYKNRFSKALFKWASLFGRKSDQGLAPLDDIPKCPIQTAIPERHASAPTMTPIEIRMSGEKKERRFSLPALRQFLNRSKNKSKLESGIESNCLSNTPFEESVPSMLTAPRLVRLSESNVDLKSSSYFSLQQSVVQILASKNILFRVEPYQPFMYHCEYQYKSSGFWSHWRRLGGGRDEMICKVNFIVEICQVSDTTQMDVPIHQPFFGLVLQKLNGSFWSYRKLYQSLTSNFALALPLA